MEQKDRRRAETVELAKQQFDRLDELLNGIDGAFNKWADRIGPADDDKSIHQAITDGFAEVAKTIGHPPPPAPDLRSKYLPLVRVQILDTGNTFEGDIKKMQISDSQQCTIEFGAPVDKKGFPAKVQDGSVAFAISDSSATVEQDASNPLKALVKGASPSPVGADGVPVAATISISADADLGDGVSTITGAEPLIVTGGVASGFGAATVGTPEEQP